MPPDEYRSEGTPSLSEGPYVRGETFGSFGAFAKGTRRKGETISRHYRSNGYVLSQKTVFQSGATPSTIMTSAKATPSRYPRAS
ncbi:hypothetical protein PS726_03292 [Pseudomonas fluorescens]|uniref:Uncharacterized protein n=1 Tax=Pseudomonas fluorescens TaxID=294 RepID=A0A8H2NXZ4_PSEFL|nr:hypothetical protein PS726_03292 [Pseudomonas fluorescens]VVP56661.1 hypothetical protein PS900_05777 [Pseudomonas fluorescens]